MDEVPQEEDAIFEERKIPTNEELLEKSLSEINILIVRANYIGSYFRGIRGWFCFLFKRKLLKEKKVRIAQLEFIEKVYNLSKDISVKKRAYILLGAFQYAQGRWLTFPHNGPLFTLELKKNELVQIISENDDNIKLENLFNDPNFISVEADKAFSKFLERYPSLFHIR